jgi:hypothetical protein
MLLRSATHSAWSRVIERLLDHSCRVRLVHSQPSASAAWPSQRAEPRGAARPGRGQRSWRPSSAGGTAGPAETAAHSDAGAGPGRDHTDRKANAPPQNPGNARAHRRTQANHREQARRERPNSQRGPHQKRRPSETTDPRTRRQEHRTAGKHRTRRGRGSGRERARATGRRTGTGPTGPGGTGEDRPKPDKRHRTAEPAGEGGGDGRTEGTTDRQGGQEPRPRRVTWAQRRGRARSG